LAPSCALDWFGLIFIHQQRRLANEIMSALFDSIRLIYPKSPIYHVVTACCALQLIHAICASHKMEALQCRESGNVVFGEHFS